VLSAIPQEQQPETDGARSRRPVLNHHLDEVTIWSVTLGEQAITQFDHDGTRPTAIRPLGLALRPHDCASRLGRDQCGPNGLSSGTISSAPGASSTAVPRERPVKPISASSVDSHE